MGFLDFIEKQQKKPTAVRQRTALFTTVIIMVIIIAVWLTTLDLALNEEKNKESESILGPFSILTDSFKEFGGIIKNIFPNEQK